MTFKNVLLPLALLASFAACSGEGEFQPDSTRSPLGKADSVGSCQDSCGGQSDGACWCDDECSYYGDCCDDKAAICDAPQTTACGGWLGDTCQTGEYCHWDLGGICGWADASGICLPTPQICIQVELLVCGCDGVTYGNSCKANAAGTSVAADGPCEPQEIFCGGIAAIDCPDGMACEIDAECAANNGADCGGTCIEVSDSCVDSCDGQSNSGSCWCDKLCEQYGDCCDDIVDQCTEDPGRVPVAGVCIKNSEDFCETDADCNAGGCGGELCFNPEISNGISTCDCGAVTGTSGCGCVNNSCTWYNE